MEDYCIPQNRRSKKQQRLKRKARVYKRGGVQRTQNIPQRV
jgi:hypothetical protein